MSSTGTVIPIRERAEAPDRVIPVLSSPLKLTPLQRAHVALLAAVSRLPREHRLAFDLPTDPEPDEVRALGALALAVAQAADTFLQRIGIELRGVSPEGVDLTVFASPFASALDGFALHEVERCAHAIAAEGEY